MPALLVLAVVGKVLEDVVVDPAQRQLSLGAGADRHDDESIVGERRLLELLLLVAAQLRVLVVVPVLRRLLRVAPRAGRERLLQLSSRGCHRSHVTAGAVERCYELSGCDVAVLNRGGVPGGRAGRSPQLHVRAPEAMERMVVGIVHLRVAGLR